MDSPTRSSPQESLHTIPRGSIPLHFQIERILRARMRSGDYPSGALLPSEGELSQQFGVSRSTIRQALGSLQGEGIVTRQPGRGTFVTSRPPGENFTGPLGSIEDIFVYVQETNYQLLSAVPIEPPPEVAQLLKVPTAAKVMEYRGVRFRGGPPFVYITTWLPMNLGQQITPEDIQNKPIVLLIDTQFGIRIGELQQRITATLATQDVAQVLNLPLRSPILLIKRLYLSREGVPVEFTANYFCPDRFEYHQRFVRAGVREAADPGAAAVE